MIRHSQAWSSRGRMQRRDLSNLLGAPPQHADQVWRIGVLMQLGEAIRNTRRGCDVFLRGLKDLASANVDPRIDTGVRLKR